MALALSLGGCASSTKPPPIAEMAPSVELGRSAEILVVAAKEGDTVATIAGRYLKDPAEFRRVAPLDTVSKAGSGLRPGAIVAIALRPLNPGGTLEDPAQRVPILCYHRFTDRAKSPSRMTVSRSDFEVQLRYLRDHGYTVIPLRALKDFLEGILPKPRSGKAQTHAAPKRRKHPS